MTHFTTIEIDEIETEVLIEFNSHFGDIEISKTTDLLTGDAIAPDLMVQMTKTAVDAMYNELHEVAADFEAVKSYTKFNYNF